MIQVFINFPTKNLITFIISSLSVIIFSYAAYTQRPYGIKPQTAGQTDSKIFLDKCENNKRGTLCYTDLFSEYAKNHDITQSLALLKELQVKDPQTKECHFIGHVLGFAEVIKNSKSWETVISNVPASDCNGGFIMGTIEGRQKSYPDFKLSPESISSLCSIVEKKSGNTSSEKSCAHTVGHLLLVQENLNIQSSNQICAKTASGFQRECYAGVFMENETRENIVKHNLGVRIPWNDQFILNQESLCQEQTGNAAIACWREISHLYVYYYKSDPEMVYKECSKSAKELVQECYIHAVGLMAISPKLETRKISTLCTPLNNDALATGRCIRIALNTMYDSSSLFLEQAVEFCADMPSKTQKECYGYAGLRASDLQPKERNSFCDSFPKIYKALCMKN